MMKSLYLDAAASTPVSNSVLRVMTPYFATQYGNPSSPHALGEGALKALTDVRAQLARALNAKAHEIVFTSGSTESNNLALFGLARAYPSKKKIMVSAIEHASIMEPARALEKQGYRLVVIPVNAQGFVDKVRLEKEIDRNTLVVSVMHVNNVVGTVQDIRTIRELCRRKGVFFHTDAAQSLGKIGIDVRALSIDLLSASAHKLGGPKGVGLLYVREGIQLESLVEGGGQERGIRSGTENVASAVGFAAALDEMRRRDLAKIQKTRDALMGALEKQGGMINGSRVYRVYNNLHVSFPGANAEMIVARLSHKGIYISTGSACESRGEKEDHVLHALGLGKKEREGSLRLSLWDPLSSSDVKRVVNEIQNALRVR